MKRTINNNIYGEYGEKWYTSEDDPVALLRHISKYKNTLILQQLKDHGITKQARILDIGCGGGFISNYLSEQGYQVTGLDLFDSCLKVAEAHDTTKKVKYIKSNILEFNPEQKYDVVLALDFLEHVEATESVVKKVSSILNKKGLFIFETINRNFLTWLLIIKLIEWVFKDGPRHLHIYRMLIKPNELSKICDQHKMKTICLFGLRPIFFQLAIFKSLWKRRVDSLLQFKKSRSLSMLYFGVAKKD